MFKKILIMLPAVFVLFVCGCDLQFEAEKKSDNENTTLLDLTKIKQEREKTEREKLEAELAEAERLEAERQEAERLEAERIEADRIETERLEAERLEAERIEAERLEFERLKAELLQQLLEIQNQQSQEEPEPASEPEPDPGPMPQMPETKKLTLMVYMAADNDLESYALQNLKDMEHAGFSGMNILVLLDRTEGFDATDGDWTDTRLLEVVHDDTDGNFVVSRRLRCPNLGLSASVETELDMANPNVLRNFISFAKSEYEAEKYALIIWGHGTGWRGAADNPECQSFRACAIDDTNGTYMTVSAMGRALKNLGLCVIGFDTCFGGVFENVYEIKNCAEYTVASPGVSPSGGWDYRQLLENISESDFTTNSIAGLMADSSSVSSTVFTNSKLRNVMEAFESFSEGLAGKIVDRDSHASVFQSLKELVNNHNAYFYSQGKSEIYLDMYCMANAYSSAADYALKEKAVKLKNEISRAACTTFSDTPQIGIYFIPRTEYGTFAVNPSSDYTRNFDNASQCLFIKESQWWVPTQDGNSGSLFDKLFYTSW